MCSSKFSALIQLKRYINSNNFSNSKSNYSLLSCFMILPGHKKTFLPNRKKCFNIIKITLFKIDFERE